MKELKMFLIALERYWTDVKKFLPFFRKARGFVLPHVGILLLAVVMGFLNIASDVDSSSVLLSYIGDENAPQKNEASPLQKVIQNKKGMGGSEDIDSVLNLQTDQKAPLLAQVGGASTYLQSWGGFEGYEEEDSDAILSSENGSILYPGFSVTTISEKKRAGIEAYVVKDGDTLGEVAEKYGLDVETIIWENGLSDTSIIRPGDRLTILPMVGVSHEVKSGDTLDKILKKYKVPEEDQDLVFEMNNLSDPESIQAGQKLVLPNGVKESLSSSRLVQENSERSRASVFGEASGADEKAKVAASGFVYPVSGYNYGRRHSYNGTDITRNNGAPVHASWAGVVIKSQSGWNGGYGNHILIKHDNGCVTNYAHLSRISVSVGKRVEAGEVVGNVGSTGRSTGPHLHFEVRGCTNPLIGRPGRI